MKATEITLETVVSRAVDLPLAQLDDESLALDENAGYYYVFNPTATRVWELIQQPMVVDNVCARLLEEFEVDEATCRREVLDLLRKFGEAKLLRIVTKE